MTVTGKTMGENIAGAKVHLRDVIHPMSDPISSEPATGVLFGNLAPRGADHQAVGGGEAPAQAPRSGACVRGL